MTVPPPAPTAGVDRRRFLGFVLGGATLVTAADLVAGGTPAQAAPSLVPQPAELYDLNDLITDAARPTANLITITITDEGRAQFALPRSENGQGIIDSTAMLIAEELDLPVEMVDVTLADARPELVFNQITGGSTTTTSTFTPIRVAAAIARGALLQAAATLFGDNAELLRSKAGVVEAPDGRTASYAELTRLAASSTDRQVAVDLKPVEEFSVIGTPVKRKDARDAVTGRKKYTLDLDVPDALPTMVCRPPSLNGTPERVANLDAVRRMPGVTDVVQVETGVAVRAATFGQCIDAVRALEVSWRDGPVVGESDGDIRARLRAARLPFGVPKVPLLAKTVEHEFTFWFKSNSALEPNAAIADVRDDSAEVWSGLKNPIVAQQEIALAVGLPQDKVKVHVVQGGGSFGRKLFFDGALEAAKVSKAMGKPVRLMWHRADDTRQGRVHPAAVSKTRTTYLGKDVLSFEQRHASVSTDYAHGLGEILSAFAAKLPNGNYTFAQSIFLLTQELGYNFGVVDQLLNEVDERFNTGSMRNIYSPDTRTAIELTVDDLAGRFGQDPLEFRLARAKSGRTRKTLETVAAAADWGKKMPAGTAQGIAIHKEYKGVTACVVELDCRPETVNRQIREARTGPRVTRATFAIDAGLVINPNHLEAQMQGGMLDGIALALTSSVHLRDGAFLEASWDNVAYTRQWNVPPEMEVVIVDSDSGQPGGAGEAGVAATCAAVACAYWRATGTMPTEFPINHQTPLHFEVKPFSPPVPPSPTNGRDFAR